MGVAMVHGPRQFFTFGPWSHPHIVMWSLWSVGNEEHFLSSRGSSEISFYSAGIPAGTIERVPDTGCYLVGHL